MDVFSESQKKDRKVCSSLFEALMSQHFHPENKWVMGDDGWWVVSGKSSENCVCHVHNKNKPQYTQERKRER